MYGIGSTSFVYEPIIAIAKNSSKRYNINKYFFNTFDPLMEGFVCSQKKVLAVLEELRDISHDNK